MTTTVPATDLTTTIDGNLAAYSNPDGATRRTQLEAVWAADGTLIDPPIDGTGIAGIDALMAAVQSQFPGHTFRRTSGVDAHHDVARYSWALVASDGSVSLEGLDVVEVDAEGRLTRILGFIGPLPTA
jgi:hypothetical protein